MSELEQVNNRKSKSPAGTFWASSWTHADVYLSSLQNEAPLFSQDGLKFFFTRAIPQGGRGKFFHISMSTSLVSSCRILLMMFLLTVCYSVFNAEFSSSLTRAPTYFSPWPLETGMSQASWRTIMKRTSCKTFGCFCAHIFLTVSAAKSFYLTDVFQILSEHRGWPQTTALVQVGF